MVDYESGLNVMSVVSAAFERTRLPTPVSTEESPLSVSAAESASLAVLYFACAVQASGLSMRECDATGRCSPYGTDTTYRDL